MVKENKTKILICGLGSIGKRHMENLEKLGFECKDILIYRTNKGTKKFGSNILEAHRNRHQIFLDLDEALKQKPLAVIISNPTSFHIPIAIKAAKAGCHLFIEKPISHTIKKLDALEKISKKNKLVVFIAYQLRFHPLLRQVKQWIEEKKIGKIVSVHAEMAERVTDWHPWESYKISYASRKDLGGGVILTQSHEIDYLYWLFRKPEWIFTSGGELGDLKIDVEDTAKSIIQFPNKVLASLHVDYLKRPSKRFLEIAGTKGRILWDYFGKKIELISLDGKTKTVHEPLGFEKNAMYLDEIEHFLNCVKKNRKPLIDLKQGKDVLEIALAMKKSMQEKKIVYL